MIHHGRPVSGWNSDRGDAGSVRLARPCDRCLRRGALGGSITDPSGCCSNTPDKAVAPDVSVERTCKHAGTRV